MEVRNIVYDESIGEAGKLDLYLPDGIKNCPVLVYFHGGGIEGGDKCDMQPFPRELQKNGIAVVSANYRMYPDVKFPEFIRDCASAVAFVKNEGHRYANFGDIFVGGSSAGAYLAMMLFFDKNYLGEHGIDPNELAGYLFDSGQPTVHFNVLRERGLDTRLVRLDEAAPLYFIDQEYENPQDLPSILIIVADNDMANRLEQNYLLKETLLVFGFDESKINFHVMKGYSHCGYGSSELFFKIVTDFIKQKSLRNSSPALTP